MTSGASSIILTVHPSLVANQPSIRVARLMRTQQYGSACGNRWCDNPCCTPQRLPPILIQLRPRPPDVSLLTPRERPHRVRTVEDQVTRRVSSEGHTRPPASGLSPSCVSTPQLTCHAARTSSRAEAALAHRVPQGTTEYRSRRSVAGPATASEPAARRAASIL